MFFDSDLAEERRNASFKEGGVLFSERRFDGLKITDIRVTSEEGEAALGKPRGRYLTLSFDALHLLSRAENERLKNALCELILDMLPPFKKILILGLGNRYMRADAIGSLSAEGAKQRLKGDGVFCLTPATKEQSGADAAILARGVLKETGAEAVIAIDALAAKDKDRLFRAIEIADTGICPGSGVGRHALAVSEETVGVRVLSLGVPTVMRAATFLKNALAEEKRSEEMLARCALCGEGLFTLPMDFEEETDILTRVISQAVSEAIQRKRGI